MKTNKIIQPVKIIDNIKYQSLKVKRFNILILIQNF